MITPVTNFIRSVAAARWAKSANGSWKASVCLYAPLHPGRDSAFAPSTWSNASMWL